MNKDVDYIQVKNNFFIDCLIENNFILLDELNDFHFLKLIFGLTDIFEHFHMDIHTTSSATVFILMKHFFEDFGYSQKYLYLNVTREKEENRIDYKVKSSILPIEIKEKIDADDIPIDFSISFDFDTSHKMRMKISVHFCEIIPEFIEKMIAPIVKKIFFNLKQYIEKLR